MASGGTVVQYNGVTIANCLTRRFTQESVYDESGTDLIYFRYTVRVVGYVHGNNAWSSVYMTPNPNGGSAAGHEKAVRYLLAQPRGGFSMRVGVGPVDEGEVLLIATAFPPSMAVTSDLKDRDVANGPKPKFVEITHITGDTIMQVEFEIEVCKVECDSDGGCPNESGVLNNRWSMTDEINEDFFTTRTIQGRLKLTNSNVNPHTFRNLVVPGLQPGMKRKSMTFVATEDALELDYNIVDEEIAFSAPAPATKWSMRYSERFDRSGQIGFYSSIQVMLAGDRAVNKKKLIEIAASIATAKLIGQPNRNQKQAILMNMEVTDEYGDGVANAIYLTATVLRVPNAQFADPAVLGLGSAQLGKPVDISDVRAAISDYDSNLSRGARTSEPLEVQGPISLIGAFASYLQSPCGSGHAIFLSGPAQPSSDATQVDASTVPPRSLSDVPDDGSLSYFNQTGASAVYTHYQMESTYQTDRVRAHLPIAQATQPSNQDTSVVVTLGRGLTRRILRIRAERNGDPPQLPYPVDSFQYGGLTHTLLKESRRIGVPEHNATSGLIYRSEAEYVYALNRPPTIGDALIAGVNPYDQTGLYAQVISGNDAIGETNFPLG